MKKRIVALLLGVTMAMSVTTTVFADENGTAEENYIEGGWSVNQGSIKPSAKVNKEAKQAFDKAMENLSGCECL